MVIFVRVLGVSAIWRRLLPVSYCDAVLISVTTAHGPSFHEVMNGLEPLVRVVVDIRVDDLLALLVVALLAVSLHS